MSSVDNKSKLAVAIRPMLRADLQRVLSLERLIFPDPWPKSAFVEQFNNPDWDGLVAESDGVIIGYACFLIAAGECHLANIAIAPASRRKSVAKQLLFRILDIAADHRCELIILEVRVSNSEAIAFYRRFGFEELYTRPKYYHSPPEDALVMQRRLSDSSGTA